MWLFCSDGEDELETFRSRWRQEIEKGRDARSPIRSRSGQLETHPAAQPSPRRSEEAASSVSDRDKEQSPLDVYESAIMKERQGSLSEAVIHYRKAFKVPPPLSP